MAHRHLLKPVARVLPAALAVVLGAVPLGAPTAARASARPAVGPIAHIALGPSKLTHARRRGPVAHIALGVVHADVARRHGRRRPHSHASSVCPGADTPTTGAAPATVRSAVLCLVNNERAARGLPPLAEDSHLNRSAQGWTDTMMRTGQYDHGTNFAGRILIAGYHLSTAGENIATGNPTPRSVVAAWMASPGHCRNILNPSFADVGTGLANGMIGGGTGATWTQDFGLWMGQSAPSRNTAPMNSCGTGG